MRIIVTYIADYMYVGINIFLRVLFFIFSIFPKTDYTYSQMSQCRYEVAPGVMAIPNMSRRSIHSDNSTEDSIPSSLSHQNLDSYLQKTHTDSAGIASEFSVIVLL